MIAKCSSAAAALIAALGFGLAYLTIIYATRRKLAANGEIIATAYTQRVKTVREGLGGIRDILIDDAQQVFIAKFDQIESRFRRA